MYNVFTIDAASSEGQGHGNNKGRLPPSKSSEPDVQRSTRLTRSCGECRRRRIRCDGNGPCGQCTWYKVPERCYYPIRRKRTVPSQQSFATISSALEKSSKILETLFPNTSLDTLSSLTRDELVALVSTRELQNRPSGLNEDKNDPFECLEPSPDAGYSWDESTRNQSPGHRVSDDVNGLSLALDSKSSFLGISSISAILRVMAHIAPDFRSSISEYQAANGENKAGKGSEPTGTNYDEAYFIDAYFAHIHCVTPIIDESEFRSKYARGGDNQPPWLALLNMVLAMGSITTSDPDETSHEAFYAKAYQNLGLDSLGKGHLETIQALGLLGGYYCHYLNQPNMANVIMGAALRMAIAMALHREPISKAAESSETVSFSSYETRRRVWWCLFCLDAWASLTLGRPSLGRWDKDTITVDLPSKHDFAGISLRASVDFCRIATALQDRFARDPLISCEEIVDFDIKVVDWHKKLPTILQTCEPCQPGLKMARGLINARYQNLRLVLYRPRLLTTTLLWSFCRNNLSSKEQVVVKECRSIASEIISSIQNDWFPIQTVVRNSIWFMFNACMVPLLSLLSDPNHEDAETWRQDVENSLSLCDKMSSWSPVIERTREVISVIYSVSNNPEVTGPPCGPDVEFSDGWDSWNADTFWDDSLESLLGVHQFDSDFSRFGEIYY